MTQALPRPLPPVKPPIFWGGKCALKQDSKPRKAQKSLNRRNIPGSWKFGFVQGGISRRWERVSVGKHQLIVSSELVRAGGELFADHFISWMSPCGWDSTIINLTAVIWWRRGPGAGIYNVRLRVAFRRAYLGSDHASWAEVLIQRKQDSAWKFPSLSWRNGSDLGFLSCT